MKCSVNKSNGSLIHVGKTTRALIFLTQVCQILCRAYLKAGPTILTQTELFRILRNSGTQNSIFTRPICWRQQWTWSTFNWLVKTLMLYYISLEWTNRLVRPMHDSIPPKLPVRLGDNATTYKFQAGPKRRKPPPPINWPIGIINKQSTSWWTWPL